MLNADRIPGFALNEALTKPSNVRLQFHGNSYTLEVYHPELPSEKQITPSHSLKAEFEGRSVTFELYFEDNSICLECLCENGIPEHIRDSQFKFFAI